MQDDHHAVPGRQPDETVLELVAQLRPGEDLLWIDRVVVVMPAVLDVRHDELIAVRARAVDDQVDQDPIEPRSDRSSLAELPTPSPGPKRRLLGQFLGHDRIAGQVDRQPRKARQLGLKGGAEVRRVRRWADEMLGGGDEETLLAAYSVSGGRAPG